MHVTILAALRQATQPVQPSDILQALILGIVIVFAVSVWAAGFTAKRIENIYEPTYTKAFGATLLKNLAGWTALAVFGLYLNAPLAVTLVLAVGLVPIFIYRFVFSCMWREAALIWLGALVVEAAVGYGLVVAGLVKLASITGGQT